MIDRATYHEEALYEILVDYTTTPAERNKLDAWRRSLPAEYRLKELVTALSAGVLYSGWPWTGMSAPCPASESSWVADSKGRPGRRLQLRHCTLTERHDDTHAWGAWGIR